MSIEITEHQINSSIKPVARAGMVAKGLVYCLLGLLAFMGAFELGRDTPDKADKQGVMQWVEDLPGGQILLGVIGLGLACFALWRLVQVFSVRSDKGAWHLWALRVRSLFSGLAYGSLAFYALKMAWGQPQGGGRGGNRMLVAELLDKPFGQALVWILALGVAAAGIYQAWFGLSGKYKKYVQGLQLQSREGKLMLKSGRIGYLARGMVWLIIAWLLVKAARSADAGAAGDTGEAFQLLESGTWGSLLLGAVALGLICYGIFSIIRSRYDQFK